eukprot:TRINITY_DN353_c0_g1_i10.p1 TRINITY_DN353_c0_g1~~TRINITY_DN353_c0_g1_i10.p1  ORF type:complete len:377 (+),score=31.65 TRINITY_DN353_c0_g1_i10:73-1203(+)
MSYSRSTRKRQRSPSPQSQREQKTRGLQRVVSYDHRYKVSDSGSQRQRWSTPSPLPKDNLKYSYSQIYDYDYVSPIAEGAYGAVFLGIDKRNSRKVAIKKLKLTQADEDTKLYEREIDLLMECDHPNVVKLIELATNKKGDKFLIFDFVDYDLKQILNSDPHQLTCGVSKYLLCQLISALEYLHSKNILHRDIKPRNILVASDGTLVLADLGSSRYFLRGAFLTPGMVTLRYRSPDVLLGGDKYDTSADMWSVGCLFAELLNCKPLFEGITELEILDNFCTILGTPDNTSLPGFSQLPGAKRTRLPQQPVCHLKQLFPLLSDLGFDLLSRFLTYDPAVRISASDAKNHAYFNEDPLPDHTYRPSVEIVYQSPVGTF